jgi:pyruvate carboxylase
MSGVVVEVRVKEGQEVKKGDIICGKSEKHLYRPTSLKCAASVQSAMKMESAVSAPVSGHIKRVLVQENDSLNQGDLVAEIVH